MSLTPEQFVKGGHGKTGPWVDLVNSEEWDTYGKRTDYLEDPSWIPYFLKQWQFPAPRGETFPKAKFKKLRAALRRSCEAVFADRSIPQLELSALNDALNVMGRHQLLQRQNGLQLEFAPVSEGWDWILAQTTLSFALLLAYGESARVKICQNASCKWVFYDTTRAKTRRWCSDKVCGNRERVRRSRARLAR